MLMIRIAVGTWGCDEHCDASERTSSSETAASESAGVATPLFDGKRSFFVSADKTQVKYEMLRAHVVDRLSATETARYYWYKFRCAKTRARENSYGENPGAARCVQANLDRVADGCTRRADAGRNR